MKRVLTAFLAIVLVLSPLSLCVSAEKSSDSTIKFNENTAYNVIKPFENAPHTVEAWIKFPQNFSGRGGIILGNYGSARAAINFEISNNGQPRLYYSYSDKTVYDYKFSCDVRTGDWAHIAFVHDMEKKEARVYLNGELAGTKEGVPEYDLEALKYPMGLGGDNRGGNAQYFKGEIRSVTAYADVRTDKEIRSGMNGPNLDDYDLIAHYDLSGVSGDKITDGGKNGYDVSFLKTWFSDKEPVTDYAYSFAVVGDTQIMAYKYPEQFHKIYDWIIANKDSKKIAHVMGLGDITDKNTAEEWAVAKKEIEKMNGVVDYTLVIGNHDKSAEYNATFGTDEYKKNFGGFYKDGKIENSYRLFTVDGSVTEVNYLLITLEYGAGDDILNWAASIIEQYPTHKVIITTHCYLYRDGTTLDKGDVAPPNSSGANDGKRNNGDQMWDKLIRKYENIFLVLSGHDPCANVVTTQTKGDHGNIVTQMLIDPQGIDSSLGATGMVAMLYFSNDGKTITVENYSTVRNEFYLSTNQYVIDISDPIENADDGEDVPTKDDNGGLSKGAVIAVAAVGGVVVVGGAAGFIIIKKRKK